MPWELARHNRSSGGTRSAEGGTITTDIPARLDRLPWSRFHRQFLLGAAAGAGASLLFLDPNLIAPNLGWRLGFAIGGTLGLGILLLRHYVPESPRWLITHGWTRKADATIADIEQRVRSDTGAELEPPHDRLRVHPRRSLGFGLSARAMFGKYRSRSLVVLALMVAQAFLFNAVFFSYGLVLSKFHGVLGRRERPN